jgi:hypothetical protein
MTDERLKIWIELGKWAVVSVGLVVMTKIIDTGFKDREVGINEIKEYDKYVSLVTDNTKISERRLLAQYFAHVTPSEQLKDGWKDYFATVDKEFRELIEEREKKQQILAELKLQDSSMFSSPEVQQLKSEIENIENELTPTFKKTKSSMDYESAINWERKGFERLINYDLEEAITAFENSENSYNSFRQVYEIGRFLKKRKNSGEIENEEFWQDIYQTILNDYSWKMPKDVRMKLEESIK